MKAVFLLLFAISFIIPSAYAASDTVEMEVILGYDTAIVNWTIPDGDYDIDHFMIEANPDDSSARIQHTENDTTIRSFEFTGLDISVGYEFKVNTILEDTSLIPSNRITTIPSQFTIAPSSGTPPTQPNALASYNNATNQVQVSWDFTTGGINAPTKCLLKGDFWYYNDLNTNHGNSSPTITTYVKSFTPLFYSPVTSAPVSIQAVRESNAYAEEVPCTGDMRIDIDTVMNHSQNVNNYLDLQIFLTFYAPLPNGDFNTSSINRIDEVFVMYTPNLIFDENAYRVYGCNGQIGSTLYIDKSGSGAKPIAYGDNGDNCGDHLYLENNQYVDIGMDGAVSPLLSDGEILYGYHDTSSYPLLTKVVSIPDELNTNNGGSGNEWKTRPTFGVGHEVPSQLVTGGFTFDDIVYDITDNWHTDFNSIEIKVGETHTFIQKGLFPKIMKVMGFNLGIAEIGKGYDSELQIDVFFDYQGNITHIELNQDTNIIDPESLHVHNFKVACDSTDTQKKCDAVSYTMKFLEPLQYDIMAMQGTDQKNRSQWTYLNEGFDVNGKSLNPMKTDYTIGTEKYEGAIKVTQKEKYSDIWIADNGREFQRNNSDSFVWINQTFEKSTDPDSMVMTRMHSEYYKLVEIEQGKAVLIFDASKYTSELGESFTYDVSKSAEQQQIELDIRINNEIDRLIPLTKDYTLNQYMYQKDSYDHWNYYGGLSLAEINALELEKKLRVQNELLQQRINDKIKYG